MKKNLNARDRWYIQHSNTHQPIQPQQDSHSQRSFEQFNDYLTIPERHGQIKLYPFQLKDIIQNIIDYKQIWLKKCTGAGATWIILRFISWLAIETNELDNTDVAIIVGPSQRKAIELIERLKEDIRDKIPIQETEKVILKFNKPNSCTIHAIPSHHVAEARAYPNPSLFMIDEGDYFPPGQQDEVRAVCERYLGKTIKDPYIIMVSTPFNPGGLFDKIEKEQEATCVYKKVFLPYTIPFEQGFFSEHQIKMAQRSPHFEREYNLKYGYGIGNIFPHQLLDQCVTTYELSFKDGYKVLALDPGWGSSQYGMVGIEKLDNIIYVKEATQYERASPGSMLDVVIQKSKNYNDILIDSSQPGPATDLRIHGVTTIPIKFNQELSNMTINSAQAVKELKVRIHPAFSDLLYQLRAVTFNEKGHPDKKKLTFDLGDAFIMAVSRMNLNTAAGFASWQLDEESVKEAEQESGIKIVTA